MRARLPVIRAVVVGALVLAAPPALGGLSPAAAVPTIEPPSSVVTADPDAVAITFSPVTSGLDQPVLVQSANDGRSALYVVERAGRIRLWTPAGLRGTAYLDIRGRVNDAGGEQGLLGLAFSPTFATDRRFWVAYTDAAGALQVSRFRAPAASSTSVPASSEVKVLRVAHPTYTNHNAGMLVFGVGKLLFIGTGDGGGGGDPFGNAQDRTSRSGKILRINPFKGCGGNHYCIPASNPYASPGGALGAIWHYGLRNPWRFSVDRVTHDLWIADVGQDRYEEFTHIPYDQRGWNLGWSCREGRSVYNSARCSATATYHGPTAVYSHSYGASIIGGYVYRGSRYASSLGGLYVYGDYISGHVWVYGAGHAARAGELGAYRLTGFGEGDTGEIYATTFDGGLYRVVASS